MKLTFERHLRIHRIYDRIRTHYGRSTHYTQPPILVLTHDPAYQVYGEFSVERSGSFININLYNCYTMRQVVGTLIHEYTHYLQDIDWDIYTGKDEDPAEIEANEIAKRDWKLFMEVI